MVSGRDCVQINLYPEDSEDKPYHTMQLFVDETALEVVRIVVKGREGMDTEYLIDSFKTGVQIPTSVFSFETNQYPGATIIDNRI
jgi:outer membrane lipoprotein-sorting protein